jgi:hypothetical protein
LLIWEVNKAGLSSNFWENCMILKKISIGKRSFIVVCYISRKITVPTYLDWWLGMKYTLYQTIYPVLILYLSHFVALK